MGFFSKFVNSADQIEKSLLNQYATLLTPIMGSETEALNAAISIVERAKEESINEGTFDLPLNFGDILIENENGDDWAKSYLKKVRNEGVKDDDVKNWHNLHDIERKAMIIIDEIHHLTTANTCERKGINDPNEILKKIRKVHPFYGDPADLSQDLGEDRPLPYELKIRINDYIMRRAMNDPEKYKEDMETYTSFNALIRKEMQNNNL